MTQSLSGRSAEFPSLQAAVSHLLLQEGVRRDEEHAWLRRELAEARPPPRAQVLRHEEEQGLVQVPHLVPQRSEERDIALDVGTALENGRSVFSRSMRFQAPLACISHGLGTHPSCGAVTLTNPASADGLP